MNPISSKESLNEYSSPSTHPYPPFWGRRGYSHWPADCWDEYIDVAVDYFVGTSNYRESEMKILNQTEAFETIFKRTGSCSSIFIAGGAVADYDKAGDIDVWFAKTNTPTADKFLTSMPFFERAAIGERNYVGGGELVGEGYIPGIMKPIQVLISAGVDCKETLSFFDLSCHAHAILSRKQERVSHKEATAPDEPIRLLNKGHKKTLGRYIKLCARYGHTLDEVVLKELSEEVPEPLNIQQLPVPKSMAWLNELLKTTQDQTLYTIKDLMKPTVLNMDVEDECPF
jgi:hypothetical protein